MPVRCQNTNAETRISLKGARRQRLPAQSFPEEYAFPVAVIHGPPAG